MNNRDFLSKIVENIVSHNFKLDAIGTIKEKTSNNIFILDPNNKEIKRIVVFFIDEKINKINFVFDHPVFSLDDLKETYGDFQTGYSFRDNLTKFSFSSIDQKIKEITTKKNNNVLINQNEIIEKDPYGNKVMKTSNEPYFNSVCYSLNI